MQTIYIITMAVRTGRGLKRLGNMQGFYTSLEAAGSALDDFRVGDREMVYQIEAHNINH